MLFGNADQDQAVCLADRQHEFTFGYLIVQCPDFFSLEVSRIVLSLAKVTHQKQEKEEIVICSIKEEPSFSTNSCFCSKLILRQKLIFYYN